MASIYVFGTGNSECSITDKAMQWTCRRLVDGDGDGDGEQQLIDEAVTLSGVTSTIDE